MFIRDLVLSRTSKSSLANLEGQRWKSNRLHKLWRSPCQRRRLGYDGPMAIHDLTSQRLFVAAGLSQGASFALDEDQSHYLINVLRVKIGGAILVFNGRDGEWRARLSDVKKRNVSLAVDSQIRPQANGPDIDFVFAPLKHARLDYMVQKAVEMGVARLQPVMTRRTVAERVNLTRMRANAIEAAEQCGILRVPEICEPKPLLKLIEEWPSSRRLIFCDEGAPQKNPIEALSGLKAGPLAVLVGPEGGFDEVERQLLSARDYVIRLSLGPRILRADTAGVAALTLVNATLGDWFS